MRRLLMAATVIVALGATPRLGLGHGALGGVGAALADTLQQCPVVVTNTTLQTDCEGPMLIGADNVDVNLNGHQVFCAVAGSADGIDLPSRQHVRIENGRVDNCSNGIALGFGSDNHFTHLLIDNNHVGVSGYNTSDNAFSGDTVITNHFSGIYFTGESNYNTFRGMVIDGNGDVDGVGGLVLDIGSSYNTVSGSDISYNHGFGVYICCANPFPPNFGVATGNDVESTQIDHTLPGSPQYSFAAILAGNDNTMRASEVSENYKDGVVIYGQGTTVQAVRAFNNALDGITAGAGPNDPGAVNNLFQADKTGGNGRYDLADYPPGPCTLNTWKANEGDKLYDGCEEGKG